MMPVKLDNTQLNPQRPSRYDEIATSYVSSCGVGTQDELFDRTHAS
jgi:hypothetical protein